MTTRSLPMLFLAAVAATSCGGAHKDSGASPTAPPAKAAAADPNAVYGPLDVGADYTSYRKVTKAPQISKTHGGRLVEIWVNDVGYDAYVGEKDELPVGSIIVKTSEEVEDGKGIGVAGPIFVMQKREAGYDPDRNDWYYALHWEQVPQRWKKAVRADQVYWRSPSPKVGYCWKCHEDYLRELGMPSKGNRVWE